MASAPAPHEQAWADALAEEHAHQRELLAVLREELGAFARECASALSALDAAIGLAGVAETLNAARTGYQHAALARDVARRLPALAQREGDGDSRLVELYGRLGGDDVPPPLVRHAAELLRTGPKRTDRELLQAVVNAAGANVQIEQIVGPAPWAALAALRPLARWAPALAAVHRGERDDRDVIASAGADLTTVLQAAATLGAGFEETVAADVSALADSLRDTVKHVEHAVRAVEQGKLAEVLAEARRTLEADLHTLRGVHETAHEASEDWREARRAEHGELSEEVRVKLERIERTRRLLAALLPRLQLVGRALTAVERAQAVERRLDPEAAAAVEAARMSLLLAAAGLWAETVSHAPHRPHRGRRVRARTRWLVAAVVAVAGVAVAIALSTGGSSKPAAAPRTTTITITSSIPAPKPKPKPAPQPRLSPVKAVFDSAQRATFYTVTVAVTGQGAPRYAWRLSPPPDNPGCNRFAPVPGSPNRAVWHHADTDGCAHTGTQHDGTVHVTVTTNAWRCTQSFFGTETRTGAPAQTCRRL